MYAKQIHTVGVNKMLTNISFRSVEMRCMECSCSQKVWLSVVQCGLLRCGSVRCEEEGKAIHKRTTKSRQNIWPKTQSNNSEKKNIQKRKRQGSWKKNVHKKSIQTTKLGHEVVIKYHQLKANEQSNGESRKPQCLSRTSLKKVADSLIGSAGEIPKRWPKRRPILAMVGMVSAALSLHLQ